MAFSAGSRSKARCPGASFPSRKSSTVLKVHLMRRSGPGLATLAGRGVLILDYTVMGTASWYRRLRGMSAVSWRR